MVKGYPGERGYVLLLVPVILLAIITLSYTSLRKSKLSLRIAGGEMNYLQTELCSQQCASLAVNATNKAFNSGTPVTARTESCRCDPLACSNTFSVPVQDNFANCYGHTTWRTLVDVASTCREGGQELAKLTESVNFHEVPVFQFAVFFEKILELHPGPDMQIRGAAHSNDTIRIYPDNELIVHDWMTSSKTIEMRVAFLATPATGTSFALYGGGQGAKVQSPGGTFRSLHRFIPDWPAFQKAHRVAYGDQAGKCGKVESLQLNIQSLSNPRALIDWRVSTDAPDLRRWKYAWNASLIYRQGWKNNDLSTAILDNPVVIPPNVTVMGGRVAFTENRDYITVKLIPIDVRKLQQRAGDSIVYLHDSFTDALQGGKDVGGFLLHNARSLKGPFTIASNSRIYIQGSFNVDSVYIVNGARKPYPAAIACDYYTQLSNEWRGTDPSYPAGTAIRFRNPNARTVLNACLLAGMTAFNGTWSGQGGFHNYIRLMEDWENVPFEYSGSSVALWDARLSQSRFTGGSYSPPIRQWAFEPMYRSMNHLPPGTPRMVSPQLNAWEMSRQ
ncbi:MAG: hypothetical protein ABIW76_02405 [Fibrobacteria bacterium]